MGKIRYEDAHLLAASHAAMAADPRQETARALLMAFVPPDEAQARERIKILGFLLEHSDALHRRCLEGHLTASSVIIHGDGTRGLLTHHRKLERWLQLGGHCDGDGNLAAAALREAIEESGIADLKIDPRPVDLDVHSIPARPAKGARPAEPEHLHLDVRFLVYAPLEAKLVISEESKDLAWVHPEELDRYGADASLRRLFVHAFP
ncbi:MAG: 8-oxo-dGTP pyrophosphatase MutT (NUDIX family) [Planctomycetota bacterium]